MSNSFEAGRAFERRFEELTGAKPTPASGNQWFATMDFEGGRILWSLKWTGRSSFSVTTTTMVEAVEAVEAPGGRGGDTIPALCFELAGDLYATMRLSDLMIAVQERVPITVKRESSKTAQKIARSSQPQLLRDTMEHANSQELQGGHER